MEIEAIDLLKDVEFKIGTLKEARSRFADQLAPDFNIFDYLRTDEMGFSKCLADLLDPKGPHGQGRVFLDEFMRIIKAGWYIDSPQTPKVATEKSIPAVQAPDVTPEEPISAPRRIDIYLDFNHGVVGIENKPKAGDQPKQLETYASHLEKITDGQPTKKNWLLIFLSDREPSENSISKDDRSKFEANGNYVQLSYSKLTEWLDFCSSKSKALTVRIFIEELSKFVRTRVMREMDMIEENEVRNLILKDNKLEAAFAIRGAINAVKKELLKKFLKDLKGKLEASSLVLVSDDLDKLLAELCEMKAYVGFEVKKDNGQDMNLRFSFESRNLNSFTWGIVDRSSKKDGAKWSEVNKLMNDNFTNGQVSKAWPWFVCSKINDFDDIEVGDWEKSPAPWQAIQDGKLAPAIASLSEKVYNAFNGKMDLLKP